MKTLTLKPIGRVQKGQIVVNREWSKGLTGLEDFSHVLAFFWMHRAHKTDLLIHPRNQGNLPLIGFLATRTPHRPSPIGFNVLRLVKRKGNVLWVEGLDVRDGTPILDLKPYTKRDSVKKFRMPSWVKKLDALETDPLRKYAT